MEEERSFEENLNELEKISNELENQDLNLEKALLEFERGIKLSKVCNKKLEEAERKINILVQNEDGQLEEKKFEEE